MNSTINIYIANLSEDVWPFISSISDPQARVYEIEENANLADRDILALSGKENVIFISPIKIDTDFFNYFEHLFNQKNFIILSPNVHTGEICQDILKDQHLFDKINQLIKNAQKINITAYTASTQFFQLLEKFREKSVNISAPQSPETESAWTANFYGSKSGIRQFAQQHVIHEPDFKMAEGLIVSGIEDASKIAANMYLENKGVVIKTNKGHAGAGLLIFHPQDLPDDYKTCSTIIYDQLKMERYWRNFPIIIERFVEPNPAIGGGFPNVEFQILKSGQVKFLYSGGMRVTKQGVFKGMEIHEDVLSDQITAHIIDTGFFLGERLSKSGYRGYYDVDFISTKNNELFVTESNVRRTGGTHAYHTAITLFGEDFYHEVYTLFNNIYHLPENGGWNFSVLYQRLKPILFNKSRKEGLIITSVNLLKQGNFGYIIFGKTKKRAYELETEMEKLLQRH